MAEQSISRLVTSKSTDSDAGTSRRRSTGKASSSKSGEKILPNYLRASTGSCHDFCKYGRRHAFDEDTRPFLRRKAKKPPDEENSKFQPEGPKMIKAKHKTNSTTKTPPKTPEIIKWEVSPESLDRQTRVSGADTAAKKMPSRVLFTKSVDRQSPILSEVQAKKKTAASAVLTESIDSQRSVSSRNWVERKKALTQERKKAVAKEVFTQSFDSQSSILGKNSVDRRKSDALERTKTSVVKLGTSPNSKTRSCPKIIKQDLSSPSEKLKVSLKQASSKVKEDNMSAKRASSLKLKVPSPDSSRVLSIIGNSDSKKTVTSKNAAKRVQLSPTALLSPKASSSGVVRGQVNHGSSSSLKPGLKLQTSPRILLSPKTSSSGIVRTLASPRASMSRKSSLSRVASLNARKHKGLEVAPHMRNQSKIEKANNENLRMKQADNDQSAKELQGFNNDVAQEKTLYVIKMETENKVLESDHNENLSAPPLSSAKSQSLPESSLSSSHNEEDEEESECTLTDAEDDLVSEYDEADSIEETYPQEGEQKGRQRKARMLHSEDKNNQPVKLRFRRGRVIDIQPEHNSPRRLKFRQRRVIGENQYLKSDGRISFKRRGAEDRANDSKPNSEKIALRHQDEHEKKDAQGLFNNVIEETASKLVETRKSKVKALVGAFETVISLQDSKPPANAAS